MGRIVQVSRSTGMWESDRTRRLPRHSHGGAFNLTPYATDRESMRYLTNSWGNYLFSSCHQNRKVGSY